jgi:hypothetical protein
MYYINGMLISQTLVGWDNWSGSEPDKGFYRPGLAHADFLHRLLMYYNVWNQGTDIPLGSVVGYDPSDDDPNRQPHLRPVGLDFMHRVPKH